MTITRNEIARRLREERNYRLEAAWLGPVEIYSPLLGRHVVRGGRGPRLYSNTEVRKRVYDAMFAAFAWPGGYTVEYFTPDGDVLCAECAKREVLENRGTVDSAIYYEGPVEYCADCNTEIESAYGDPDAPEAEDDDAE